MSRTREDARPPQAVRVAVYLLFAAVAASIRSTALGMTVDRPVFEQALRTQLKASLPPEILERVMSIGSRLAVALIVLVVFSAILEIVIWGWLAVMISKGRWWVRLVVTILFAVTAYGLLTGLAGTPPEVLVTFSEIVGNVGFLIQLTAVILLWQPRSAPHFAPRPGRH